MIQIINYKNISKEEILARKENTIDVEAIVSDIIENVKANKDAAVFDYCKKFDKADLSSLEVSAEEIAEAVASVEPKFLEILEKVFQKSNKLLDNQSPIPGPLESSDVQFCLQELDRTPLIL